MQPTPSLGKNIFHSSDYTNNMDVQLILCVCVGGGGLLLFQQVLTLLGRLSRTSLMTPIHPLVSPITVSTLGRKI